jgi:hypothetical protein
MVLLELADAPVCGGAIFNAEFLVPVHSRTERTAYRYDLLLAKIG